jgi:hypothetical protein
LFVVSNRCIAVKNTLGYSAAVFCVCVREREYFTVVVLYIVIAVHKFDCRLVTNGTHDKWRVDRRPCSDRDDVFGRDYMPPPGPSSRVLRVCTHPVKVNYILLGKRQYLPCVGRRDATSH